MTRERVIEDAASRQRVGARVFVLRRQRKMTVLMLAERSGLHRNTVYRIEAGISLCLVGQLYRVAQALEVGIGELFKNAPLMVHRGCKSRKQA